MQADWHEFTGYLPITTAAYELAQKQGYYEKNPGAETAIKQITYKTPTKWSKGIRFGNFAQVRDIINAELEDVWSGKKSASDALDEAVDRGNKVLRQFQQTNQ